MPRRIVIVGASGFARSIRWLVSQISEAAAGTGQEFQFAGFVVSDRQRLGPTDSVDEVIGDCTWLSENRSRVDALAIGIGTPPYRRKVREELSSFGPEYWPALIHPNVQYERHSARIGEGVLVCAGSIITTNVTLMPFSMLNLSCTIGHDAVLGRYCVVNPSTNIAGGVTIGDGTFVGVGTQILQFLSIGEGASVGAGAVVNRNVPAGVTVVGIPARPIVRREARSEAAGVGQKNVVRHASEHEPETAGDVP